MNKLIRWGIIGLVTALATFGGVITLTQDELDHAWYCDNKGRIGIFERMSDTNKSGYWMEDGIEKRATCTKSHWIPLTDYCEAQGIKNCGRLSNVVTARNDEWTNKYWCDEVCDPIYK